MQVVGLIFGIISGVFSVAKDGLELDVSFKQFVASNQPIVSASLGCYSDTMMQKWLSSRSANDHYLLTRDAGGCWSLTTTPAKQ
jgi:hypothetical protein